MKVLLLFLLVVFAAASWPKAPPLVHSPLVRLGATVVVALSLMLHRVA